MATWRVVLGDRNIAPILVTTLGYGSFAGVVASRDALALPRALWEESG